jgi:hypothetical protein
MKRLQLLGTLMNPVMVTMLASLTRPSCELYRSRERPAEPDDENRNEQFIDRTPEVPQGDRKHQPLHGQRYGVQKHDKTIYLATSGGCSLMQLWSLASYIAELSARPCAVGLVPLHSAAHGSLLQPWAGAGKQHLAFPENAR